MNSMMIPLNAISFLFFPSPNFLYILTTLSRCHKRKEKEKILNFLRGIKKKKTLTLYRLYKQKTVVVAEATTKLNTMTTKASKALKKAKAKNLTFKDIFLFLRFPTTKKRIHRENGNDLAKKRNFRGIKRLYIHLCVYMILT